MYIENKQIKNQISFWLASIFWIVALMIILGGLTRLTDSGLSITQWQLFDGIFPPRSDLEWLNYFNLYKEIPEYKLQNYSMVLSEFKVIFWWEWIHRFLGRLIGICFILPLIYFSLKVNIKSLLNLYYIFLLICFQGFIGWYMVSSGLTENVDVSHFRLSVHLLLAFFILSMILWNYLKLQEIKIQNKYINNFFPSFFLILIFCQICIGAFVSGMDAGKIYNSWPLMDSAYFPDDNSIINLFKLSVFSDPSLVQFIHRNLAYLILIIYLYTYLTIYIKKISNLLYPIKIIGTFLFLQIILGILTLINGAQIILSSMHQVASIFLLSSSIYLLYLNKNTN